MVAARLDLDVLQLFTKTTPERRLDMGLDCVVKARWLYDDLVSDATDASEMTNGVVSRQF